MYIFIALFGASFERPGWFHIRDDDAKDSNHVENSWVLPEPVLGAQGLSQQEFPPNPRSTSIPQVLSHKYPGALGII